MNLNQTNFNKIGIVAKPQALNKVLSEITLFLKQRGRHIVLEQSTATHTQIHEFPTRSLNELQTSVDLIIVIGGDGTMLSVARQMAGSHIPLLGINYGRVGFITDIPLQSAIPALDQVLQGAYLAEQRSLLEATLLRDEKIIASKHALNDVVVLRNAALGMVELRVEVDQFFLYSQRSDGLIISTPTGSTAYALSAGGPLLHPGVRGLVLVPIAPHTLSNRPIVIPDHAQISIQLVDGDTACLNCDMQSITDLKTNDRILIQRLENEVVFLHPKDWNYYATLRQKLHWHEAPSAS